MKATELREKTAEELQEAYDETRQALFKLQVYQDTAELEQPLKIRTLRREVARIKTVMNEREREGVENHG